MSKPIKELIQNELIKRLTGVSSLAVVGFTGIDAITTHQIRSRLHGKNMKMMVVKNSIARHAFGRTGLPDSKELLTGPCAVVFGAEGVVSVVRELLDIKKDTPNLTVKAAVLEGDIFGAERIEELSKFPTREEAVARTVSCVLSPGGKLVGAIMGPGGKIASLLKSIQEKKEKEGGEAAA